MKTATEPTYVETSNVGQVQRASIRASATMFNLLSKQIYSNFYVAIWRELVANAVDAQKINGDRRRPIVTVPSALEPYAKVRDFGTGMSHDFMMNRFMQFGDASTKETSNDFIGGFGIGSKAPLAYTEQYSVKCFQDGKVRVYSIFKDDEGCPSIAFLSESDTTEPDGVEVGFPVRQEDIHKFSDSVVETLQYFDPLPELDNTALELNPIEYDAKGDKWGLRVRTTNGVRHGPKVIIGGVAYPLDPSQIGWDYKNLRNFTSMGLDIFLDIGEAEIAASRESVVHDDKLLKKLEGLVGNIGTEFGKQMSKQFADCKTLWDAKKLLCDGLTTLPHHAQQLFRNNAVWRGQKIIQSITRPKDFEVLVIAYGNFWNHGMSGIPTTEAMSPKFRAWQEHCYFQPNTFEMIVIDDGPEKPALRIRTVIDENSGKRILFLRDNDPDDDVDWEKYLKELGSPPKSMITYLSAYDPAKVQRGTGSGITRPFKCYVGSRPYRGTSRGLQSTLPAEGGLYVVMDNFDPLSTSSDISVAEMAKPKNTVWLNKTDFAASSVENDPKWYSVEEAIAKVKADYRSKHRDLPEAEAVYAFLRESGYRGWHRHLETLGKLPNFPKRGPLYQLSQLVEKHKDVVTSEHSHMRRKILGVNWSAQEARVAKLVKQVNLKHPLLAEIVNKGLCENLSPKVLSALI